jgi:hypothetical protein
MFNWGINSYLVGRETFFAKTVPDGFVKMDRIWILMFPFEVASLLLCSSNTLTVSDPSPFPSTPHRISHIQQLLLESPIQGFS